MPHGCREIEARTVIAIFAHQSGILDLPLPVEREPAGRCVAELLALPVRSEGQRVIARKAIGGDIGRLQPVPFARIAGAERAESVARYVGDLQGKVVGPVAVYLVARADQGVDRFVGEARVRTVDHEAETRTCRVGVLIVELSLGPDEAANGSQSESRRHLCRSQRGKRVAVAPDIACAAAEIGARVRLAIGADENCGQRGIDRAEATAPARRAVDCVVAATLQPSGYAIELAAFIGDNAADGVRTVKRRLGATKHLDPAADLGLQGADVELACKRIRHLDPVDQYEHVVRLAATQAQLGLARDARNRHARHVSQNVGDVASLALLDLFRRDDGGRAGIFFQRHLVIGPSGRNQNDVWLVLGKRRSGATNGRNDCERHSSARTESDFHLCRYPFRTSNNTCP